MIGKLESDEIEGVLHRQTIGRIGVSCEQHHDVLPVSYANPTFNHLINFVI